VFEQPKLSAEERQRLRTLARRQAEIAALPVMALRRKMWTDLNDGVPGTRPPFVIESWTFDRDFLPESLSQCVSPAARRIERQLLRHIRHHEILGDDHVCPDTYDMEWHVSFNEFGIEIPVQYEKDSEGVVTGYHFDCPIKDLNDGFDRIRPTTFELDREGTLAEQRFLEELFGDLLPVVLRSGTYAQTCLTQRMMRLMSMETFFLAMYDCPDRLHGVMALLRDNAIRAARWAESEGILELNNGNQCTCGTCFNFTTLLPRQPVERGRVRLTDMWAGMDSQETVGVSPELFHEFCFPYYRDVASLFGLVYYGCCEPVHPLWEMSLSKLPNLKALSISRWNDQRFMVEALAGRKIVYSRKPNPNLLGVGAKLDEDAWAAELRETLDLTAGRDLPVEFVVRDVYSLHGDLSKAASAVEIARREIDRRFAPLA
jgi:hypothetical protein